MNGGRWSFIVDVEWFGRGMGMEFGRIVVRLEKRDVEDRMEAG